MRLVPRSLFSRLVLVLLGGLLIAQFLSLAILMRERGKSPGSSWTTTTTG